ncbi:MAG: zinc ribbon domain-containing protein [bacterium]|nr:zinc ribbon domain-containing protein [bacterium]
MSPLYEYVCQDCSHALEKIQAFGEEPVTECPKCQGVLVRVIHAAPAIFKGGAPSKERAMQHGSRKKPIYQTDDGHWEERGIMEKR